jgi:hypothetical protein
VSMRVSGEATAAGDPHKPSSTTINTTLACLNPALPLKAYGVS